MKLKDLPINLVDQEKRTKTGYYALITAEFGLEIFLFYPDVDDQWDIGASYKIS